MTSSGTGTSTGSPLFGGANAQPQFFNAQTGQYTQQPQYFNPTTGKMQATGSGGSAPGGGSSFTPGTPEGVKASTNTVFSTPASAPTPTPQPKAAVVGAPPDMLSVFNPSTGGYEYPEGKPIDVNGKEVLVDSSISQTGSNAYTYTDKSGKVVPVNVGQVPDTTGVSPGIAALEGQIASKAGLTPGGLALSFPARSYSQMWQNQLMAKAKAQDTSAPLVTMAPEALAAFYQYAHGNKVPAQQLAQFAQFINSGRDLALFVNPNGISESGSPSATPFTMTPAQGVIAGGIGSVSGSSGVYLNPDSINQLAVTSGLTSAQINNLTSSLTPDQIAAINKGESYTIYVKNASGDIGTINQGQFTPLSVYGPQLSRSEALGPINHALPSTSKQGLSLSSILNELSSKATSALAPISANMPTVQPQIGSKMPPRGQGISLAASTMPPTIPQTITPQVSQYYNPTPGNPISSYLNNEVKDIKSYLNQLALILNIANTVRGEQINYYNQKAENSKNPLPEQIGLRFNEAAAASLPMIQNLISGAGNGLASLAKSLTGTGNNPIPSTTAAQPFIDYLNNKFHAEALDYVTTHTQPYNTNDPKFQGLARDYDILANAANTLGTAYVNNTLGSLTYLGSPGQSPWQTLYDQAYLASQIVTPVESGNMGFQGGVINQGINYLGGSKQTGEKAYESGSKFATATGPALGAAIDVISPYVAPYLKVGVANILGEKIFTKYALDDYIDTFGKTPQAQDYLNTLNKFGADTDKAYLFADKTGNIGRLFYNDVHLGYGGPQEIQDYIEGIKGDVNLAHTGGPLKNSFEIQGIDNPDYLGGVRKNAYAPTEGMYFNIPAKGGQAIQLNYQGLLGAAEGSDTLPLKINWNPLGVKGTLLSTRTLPTDIALNSIKQFETETGLDISTDFGQNAFSKWLGEQAQASGKEFLYPYQNYLNGGSELQVMGGVGTPINALTSKTALFLTNDQDQALNAVFLKVMNAENLGQDLDDVAQSLNPAERDALQTAYQNAMRSSSEGAANYISPYPSLFEAGASSIPTLLASLPSTTSTSRNPSISLSNRSISLPSTSQSTQSQSKSTELSNSLPSTSQSTQSQSKSTELSNSLPSTSQSTQSQSKGSSSGSGGGGSIKKKDTTIPPFPSLNNDQFREIAQKSAAVPFTQAYYSPDIASTLFNAPGEINYRTGAEAPNSPLLGVGFRVAPQYLSAPQQEFIQKQANLSPTAQSPQSLDMPTTGPEAPNETTLAQQIQNAQNALMMGTPLATQNTGSVVTNGPLGIGQGAPSTEPQMTLPGSMADYQNNPLYLQELNKTLMNQNTRNIQNDIARNYQSNLYLQSLYNALKDTMPYDQLQAMLENAGNYANAQYYNQSAPMPVTYAPTQYESPDPYLVGNPEGVDKQVRAVMMA